MDKLKNKVAIVTGFTSGIGIAHIYAAEGVKDIVCGGRSEFAYTYCGAVWQYGISNLVRDYE